MKRIWTIIGVRDVPASSKWYKAVPGNGLLLFFRVEDFDRALTRARALATRLEEEPHVNPNTRTAEFSLRDPDGYCVTISALSAPSPARRLPSKRSRPTKARGRMSKSRKATSAR